MPRETMTAKRERALEVARRMNEHYPAAECALHYWGDPFRLTIAVLLSAQTTDKGVNKVTPALWERYPTPGSFCSSSISRGISPAQSATTIWAHLMTFAAFVWKKPMVRMMSSTSRTSAEARSAGVG